LGGGEASIDGFCQWQQGLRRMDGCHVKSMSGRDFSLGCAGQVKLMPKSFMILTVIQKIR